ncbi:MAG: VWA domain-containing protein [Fimbriimonadaceae bacterium]|nr:MAG: VWA domain-containing protein [Fimbriimonadaceae bacterium]
MRASLLVAAMALALGCEPPPLKGTEIVAIDTSGSAREFEARTFAKAQALLAGSNARQVIVYRFDSKPAEIYNSGPFSDEAEAGKFLKRNLTGDSATKGTNLARLFELIDRDLAAAAKPVRVTVFTDCGVEMMTAEDGKACRELSEKWSGQVADLRFVGVRVGHREKLRSLVKCPIEID